MGGKHKEPRIIIRLDRPKAAAITIARHGGERFVDSLIGELQYQRDRLDRERFHEQCQLKTSMTPSEPSPWIFADGRLVRRKR